MTLYKWSQTAASNATADTSVNWQEGQAPSSVNDSARAMMASVAKYRDDIAGAIVTGGTATAYTVSSYESFDALAHLNGQTIAFTPHTTNGATVTLNVDSLGAKPLRSAPSTELLAGTLIQGTPYLALYNNSDGVFYLQGFYGNPYNVPLGGILIHTAAAAPNSSFVLPYGQAISRATYSAYFALVNTGYGAGDGSSTFNVPDLRGRVVPGADNMGGSAASRLTSASNMGTGLLGQVGGAETHTLTTAQLASHSHANTLTDPGHTHGATQQNSATTMSSGGGGSGYAGGSNNPIAVTSGFAINSAATGITITNTSAGSGSAHNNMQPSICLNYILRIL